MSHRAHAEPVVPALELLFAVASRAAWGQQSSDTGMSQLFAEPGMLSCSSREGLNAGKCFRKGKGLFLLQDEQLVPVALV